MTIITTQSRITYAGDNVTVLFPIPFEFFLNSDISAVKTSANGTVAVNLTQGIDYSLAGAGIVGGGSATKTTPLLIGETLVLFLNPPVEQQSHYPSNSPFPSSTLENDLDRQTQISQRLQDQISRSVRAPDADAAPSMLLPVAALRANTMSVFDVNGNATVAPIAPGGTNALTQTQFNTLLTAAFANPPLNTGMGNGAPQVLGAQVGTPGAPSTNAQPLVSFTHYVSATAGLGAGYVGGGLWSSCYVEGGTGDGKGLTGYVQIDGGVNISGVAVHGFGKINAATSGQLVWAGWFTTHDDAVTVVNQAFGVEIDLVLGTGRAHVTNLIGNNAAVGLWINNQSDVNGPFHGTAAIGISQEGGGAAASQWHTGIFFVTNSIVAGGANEAIQINGGSVAANRYCGMRLLSQFDSGLDMSGAVFTGTGFAMILPNGSANGGVIGAVDSGGVGVGTYNVMYLDSNAPNRLVLGASAPGGIVLNNKVGINGNAPLAKLTGWGAPTGAALLANYPGATATLAQTTPVVAQLIATMEAFGLYGN